MRAGPTAAMLVLATGFLVLGFAPQARAQYDPGGTMTLGTGMGATALGQSILSGTRNIGRTTRPSSRLAPMRQPSHRRGGGLNAKMRVIAPEYNRRVRIYGKPSADRWLARTAREMGRRDGVAARRASGR
jgi:hypothetical protein